LFMTRFFLFPVAGPRKGMIFESALPARRKTRSFWTRFLIPVWHNLEIPFVMIMGFKKIDFHFQFCYYTFNNKVHFALPVIMAIQAGGGDAQGR